MRDTCTRSVIIATSAATRVVVHCIIISMMVCLVGVSKPCARICGNGKAMCNNTAFRCYNLTEEQCDALSLAIGISDAVIAFVSLSLLVCLLALRKKDAWNSQIKRAIIAFSLFLN